jgi:hypothetical protein
VIDLWPIDAIGSNMDRFGVLWGGSGGQEVCFVISYMNFAVPECDNTEYREI